MEYVPIDIGGSKTIELSNPDGVFDGSDLSPEVRKKISHEINIVLSRERLTYEELLKKNYRKEIFLIKKSWINPSKMEASLSILSPITFV